MSRPNPYSPPGTLVADASELAEVDIDTLPVSDKWKKKFKALKKAGGPAMKNVKALSKIERRDVVHFNVLGFLFGPFYYFAKGMWKRGITLFLACAIAIIAIAFILEAAGLEQFMRALKFVFSAVFATRANIDYYKKMVLRDNGWW